MNRAALSLIAMFVMWLGTVAQVLAQERILSFHSEIQILADASMTVTETIRVQAEGRSIRRGIYREFPTRYRDQYGNRVVVDFEVLTLTRDGQPEVFEVFERSNGVRVDFGGDDLLAVPAAYEYALTYRTRRQIGYFDNHDELYWNVTGLGWNFDIDRASATVSLPQAVPASMLSMQGYTGPARATGQDYQATVHEGGGEIVTTAALPPYSGLTLAMTFPKGLIEAPGTYEKLGYLLKDNRGIWYALTGLLFSLAWLLWSWNRVGRDPKKGVVFPHYQPPADLSPAASRYIYRMAYDTKTFSAAVVNLAVKGYLRIIQQQKSFTFEKLESTQTISTDEQILLIRLFSASPVVKLENENHTVVHGAEGAHKNTLKASLAGVYFTNNGGYLLPSLVVVLLLTILIVVQQVMVPAAAALTALGFAIHIVFARLLKAPSTEGRQLMDKLEGFKLYLETAEKDDLNLAHPPDLTPEIFEQLLPYAIGLGVEQAWAKNFEKVLARLEDDGAQYHPSWYRGSFNATQIAAFSTTIGSSMSAAIASAATPPGSVSGAGGGGFSGGGGGGGGGGGR